MNVKDIYLKTMKFIWLKLALGAATVLISVIVGGICLALAVKVPQAAWIWFLVWLAATVGVSHILNTYFGYLVKAGHIAIITMAVTTGQVPDNQFEVGKKMVQERFAASNVYFVIDKLVGGAVRQLQSGLDKVDNMLGSVPGVSVIVSFAKVFVGIALGYVDECCLGYTFYQKDQGAFKSAADGVVIYFQNWKTLLKSAAVTSVVVMLATAAIAIVPFLLLYALFAALGWQIWIAVIIAVLVAIILKAAFIDSYMLIKTMVSYMQVAPTTVITFDLYDKLGKLSIKFKELFGKAQAEGPVVCEQPVMQTASAAPNTHFCPNCGVPNEGGVFCASCGGKL